MIALALSIIHSLRASTWVSIGLLLSILYLALEYQSRQPSTVTKKTAGRNAPPCVRGFPLIGSAHELLTPHASIVKYQASLGDVFSFYLFRTKVHIVLAPSVALSVFKSKSLSFREIEKWIDTWYFDYPDSMNTSADDHEFLAMEKSVKPHLVTTNGIALLSNAYLDTLMALLQQEAQRLHDGPREQQQRGQAQEQEKRVREIEDLWPWVREMAYRASTMAMFGPLFPVEETKQLYWDYEAALTEFLLFPHILVGAKKRIRAGLVAVIAAAIEEHNLEGCSGLMRDRLELGREFGYSSRDAAKICIDVLFALQANATPMTFWLLAHVVGGGKDSRIYSRIKTMVDAIPPLPLSTPSGTSADSTTTHDWDALKNLIQDDWVTSLFDESLRLHAHASIMRKCTAETQLGAFTVQPGEYVVIPTPSFQHNTKIWRDPFHFDEARFARLAATGRDKEDDDDDTDGYGKLKKEEVLIPFGGKWGLHYCPGRFFAKVEIVAMTLLMCKLFDIEALDGIPEGWIFGKYGNGAQQPVDKMKVRLSLSPAAAAAMQT